MGSIRLARSEAALAVAGKAIGLYLDFAVRSARWRLDGESATLRALATGPALVAFWHEGLPSVGVLNHALRSAAPATRDPPSGHVLISRHRDGRLISHVATHFGVTTISGSSSRRKDDRHVERGGAAAFRRMLAVLRAGEHVGITPDGPRGPARRVQPGLARLAALSGVPVVPCAAAIRPSFRLPSWDRMAVPLPFGRGVLAIGTPLAVGRGDPERLALALAAAIDVQSDRAHARPPAGAPIDFRAGRRAGGRALLAAWRVAAALGEPGLLLMLRARVARGKEDPARLRERAGIVAWPRPSGPLVWAHAASVGETVAILPVLASLASGEAAPAIVLTTGTRSSAALVAERAPPGVRHLMVPLDVPRFVARFLDAMRPDVAVFVESEIWPNMIAACRRRRIPLALVNARLSARSAARWRRVPALAARLFGSFSTVRARSAEDAARLAALGARATDAGDLKAASPALGCAPDELDRLERALGGRPCWLAASTHPGEEEIVAEAASLLRRRHPDLLTIVAPRHPERGAAVAAMLAGPEDEGGERRTVPRRAEGRLPEPGEEFWVVDTIGELGLVYRLADAVFMGRSLAGHTGGQNPLEPARLGRPVAIGDAGNFAEAAATLQAAGALARVADAASLAAWAGALLDDTAQRAETGRRAAEAAASLPHLARETADAIAALIPAAARARGRHA